MKPWLVLPLAFLLAASTCIGQVRFGGGPQVGIAFSSFPQPAGDLYGLGFVFGAHGDLGLGRYITLRLAFDYGTFGASSDKLADYITSYGVQLSQQALGRALTADENRFVRDHVVSASGGGVGLPTIMVSGLGKIPTGGAITPYGVVGVGLSFVSFSEVTAETRGFTAGGQQIFSTGTFSVKPEGGAKFALQFGAGAEYRLSRMVTLFFEARYNLIFTTDKSSGFIPLVIGATFGG